MRNASKLSLFILLGLLAGSFAEESNPFDNCFYLENTVCVKNQKTIIAQDNYPETLIGYWKFNDKYASDYSGNRNFLSPVPKVAPSSTYVGQSAYFNGTDMSIIPHIAPYMTKEFTVSFWLFILPHQSRGWATILRKGTENNELTPSIMLWPDQEKLRVSVSTEANWNEHIDSYSTIPLKRWTSIVVSYSYQLLQLYVNGQLDNQIILDGPITVNDGPFHIGRDQTHAGTSFYLDELKFYNTNLKQDYIMADMSNLVEKQDGQFLATLGCLSCNYNKAVNSCKVGYHLCSMQELYAGGYRTARAMGWFNENKDIWFRPDATTQHLEDEFVLDPNANRLGVCCSLP